MALTTNPKQLAQAITTMQPQLMKDSRFMLSSSEDTAMLRLIQEIHAHDGREINAKSLLRFVEDIFYHATAIIDAIFRPAMQGQAGALEDIKTHLAAVSIDVPANLAYTIDQISSEIASKNTSGSDAHATTISVLQHLLISYNWDAKMVLALSALAVKYGEFCLVAQSQTISTDPLAKSLAIIKQLSEILEHTSMLKPRFDGIKVLIKAMLDITNLTLKFNDLPLQYFTTDVPAFSTLKAHTPIAAYWTIRGVVACMSQIAGLIGLGHEYMPSTTEFWELSSLAHKVNNIHSHLSEQLDLCNKYLDERKQIELYEELIRLFKTPHVDNMKVLKALLCAKEDLSPIVDGETKQRVNIEVLRHKYVLLLISDLDIPMEELANLENIYQSHHTKQNISYEIVWLLIVDDQSDPWTQTKQMQFQELRRPMPWYTMYNPQSIEKPVVKFIKGQWSFKKKPILVVVDPLGQLVSPNALHMMWIWGSKASPFTTVREASLWNEEIWRLELLVTEEMDSMIHNWILKGIYICLYGGEDIDWIQNFTRTARNVAQQAGITLEMVYVGKSNPKDRVRRNILAVKSENMSRAWDLNQIWYFWVRIESMWQSKMQLGKTTDNDPMILPEIMAMLSFDSSDGGWALLSLGSADMAKAKGSNFLASLKQFDSWREHVQTKGFMGSLRDYLNTLVQQAPHHCNKLQLPSTAGQIPEKVGCTECGRNMETFVMYKCCNE
ncbi:unnamed protein product [Ilex paraguariensis]|uniref:Protein SIEVE ELEMENT OCCLUSION B-like n=1 Tax=Ilex paraguariensis TaxID=185542 RepID=A0ABC8SXB4_9AQUA